MESGRSIWLWLAGGLLAVFIVIGAVKMFGPSSSGPVTSSSGQVVAQAPPGAVAISIASSNTKEDWLREAVKSFNEASKSDKNLQVDGHPVFVEVLQETIDGKKKDYRSGTMVSDIMSGKIKPTIASPGEEAWITKLKKEWQIANNSQIVRGDSPVLVRTPLVVAMWQSRAKAIGCWPNSGPNCTWEKVRSLSASSDGWKNYGHPEWGRFKMGYGYFNESNSGTLGVISMCMMGAKKTKNLTMNEVDQSSGCGKFVNDVEKGKFHSGKSDVWLLERMIKGGPEYLDAVVTYESNVILMNRKHSQDLREPMVSVYPQDGTVVVGHPLAVLEGAPWVMQEQAKAAKIFGEYLLSRDQQAAVLSLGLRPADANTKLDSPIEAAFGANPQARLLTLELPDQLVIDRIGEVWHKVKKHSVIALVFDKSGSMAGSKIGAAIKGAEEFVNSMDLEDQLLWMPFDHRLYGATIKGTKAQIGERLIQDHIRSIGAGGDTSLYDAVLNAYQELELLYGTYGDKVRYGIVVLSDGDDTSSKASLSQLEAKLKPRESDPTGIQIHTICIGSSCNDKVLRVIASAAHGKFAKGDSAADMIRIYKDIAAHY